MTVTAPVGGASNFNSGRAAGGQFASGAGGNSTNNFAAGGAGGNITFSPGPGGTGWTAGAA